MSCAHMQTRDGGRDIQKMQIWICKKQIPRGKDFIYDDTANVRDGDLSRNSWRQSGKLVLHSITINGERPRCFISPNAFAWTFRQPRLMSKCWKYYGVVSAQAANQRRNHPVMPTQPYSRNQSNVGILSSVYPSVRPSVLTPVLTSVRAYVLTSVLTSVRPSLRPSVSLSVHLPHSLSVHPHVKTKCQRKKRPPPPKVQTSTISLQHRSQHCDTLEQIFKKKLKSEIPAPLQLIPVNTECVSYKRSVTLARLLYYLFAVFNNTDRLDTCEE